MKVSKSLANNIKKPTKKSFSSPLSKLSSPSINRILLKLSGEVLRGKNNYGIDIPTISDLAKQIIDIHQMGLEISVVIGGGNILRGTEASCKGLHRVTADHMGMLATVINGLALQDVLENEGLVTRLQTAIEIKSIAEPFIRRKAIRHLEKKRIVILAGGTGNPYFTTDTAAVLRAVELGVDAIFKATKVDGVYDSDPFKNKKARRFSYISFDETIKRQLMIMDSTAFTLCKENKIPIFVFRIEDRNQLKNAILGKQVGTLINGERGVHYYGKDS